MVAARVALAFDRASTYESLRRAEEELRVALDAGRMGVWQWTIATGRLTWSPKLEEIHGLDPGLFPGTFDAYQRDLHPDDRARVLEAIHETLETNRDHHIEYRIVRGDGQERWVAEHGKVTTDDRTGAKSMMGVCMDVTEQRQLAAAREAAVAQLEQTLRYNEIFAGIL